jgi:hypothetical protein
MRASACPPGAIPPCSAWPPSLPSLRPAHRAAPPKIRLDLEYAFVAKEACHIRPAPSETAVPTVNTASPETPLPPATHQQIQSPNPAVLDCVVAMREHSKACHIRPSLSVTAVPRDNTAAPQKHPCLQPPTHKTQTPDQPPTLIV